MLRGFDDAVSSKTPAQYLEVSTHVVIGCMVRYAKDFMLDKREWLVLSTAPEKTEEL